MATKPLAAGEFPLCFREMKLFPLAAVMVFPISPFLSAQVSVAERAGNFTRPAPVSAADQAGILQAAGGLLRQHVTFRPDGTAFAIYAGGAGGKRLIEWKSLTAKEIIPVFAGSWSVKFAAAAHRSGVSGDRWGAWQSGGFPGFPAVVGVVKNPDGSFTAKAAELAAFSPGPVGNPAPGAPTRNSTRSSDLGDGLRNFR